MLAAIIAPFSAKEIAFFTNNMGLLMRQGIGIMTATLYYTLRRKII